MKILHVVSSYYPAFSFGGPIESVHKLNKFLVKKGVDTTVYTSNSGLRNIRMSDIQKLNLSISGMSDIQNIGKGKCEIDGVRVFYFPYYGYVHWTFSPALFLALGREVKNFDLVHITGVWNFPVWAAAFWARFYKKPHIISPRGSLMKEPLEKKSQLKKKIYLSLITKRDFKKASAIHFTVEKEKKEYLKAGLPLRKAVVIPNGLDIKGYEIRNEYEYTKLGNNFRKKFGIHHNAKIVLFLSRLNWKKGLDTLIPAFSEVIKKEPKAVLVLAGGDEKNYKKEIIKMINNRHLTCADFSPHNSAFSPRESASCIFTGMLLGEDKVAAYQIADVFVLPSYSENFGMVVVEAMAAEKPVVITKGVGISKEVEAAGAGIVIDKDEKQLAEAILKILDNPDLAKKIGERGKRLVETEFSWPEIASRFMEAYKNL